MNRVCHRFSPRAGTSSVIRPETAVTHGMFERSSTPERSTLITSYLISANFAVQATCRSFRSTDKLAGGLNLFNDDFATYMPRRSQSSLEPVRRKDGSVPQSTDTMSSGPPAAGKIPVLRAADNAPDLKSRLTAPNLEWYVGVIDSGTEKGLKECRKLAPEPFHPSSSH
jgi:hypothetical protein